MLDKDKRYRISKNTLDHLPKSIADAVRSTSERYHQSLKTFKFHTADTERNFSVGEGDYFYGINSDGQVANFEAVHSDTVGGAGLSYSIGKSWNMPHDSWLIHVHYYGKYYMTLYHIVDNDVQREPRELPDVPVPSLDTSISQKQMIRRVMRRKDSELRKQRRGPLTVSAEAVTVTVTGFGENSGEVQIGHYVAGGHKWLKISNVCRKKIELFSKTTGIRRGDEDVESGWKLELSTVPMEKQSHGNSGRGEPSLTEIIAYLDTLGEEANNIGRTTAFCNGVYWAVKNLKEKYQLS